MSSSDKLTDFAIDKMQHFFDGLNANMPRITHAVLTATQIDCVISILTGFAYLAIAFIGFFGMWFFIKQDLKEFKVKLEKYGQYAEYKQQYMSRVLIFGALMAFFSMVSCVYLMNGWTWVGMFHPDLYLIHMALSKVTG